METIPRSSASNEVLYIKSLLSLNRDKKWGGAPHKPILLISIAQLVREGEISSNQVEISPEILLRFKENWERLVQTPHTENFSLPFFHMRSEGFWRLISIPGREINVNKSKSIKSFKNLRENLAFAEMDKELFRLFRRDKALEVLLLDNYFGGTKLGKSSLYENIKGDLSKSKQSNQTLMKKMAETMDDSEFEEAKATRSAVFKKEIPALYEFRCAISEMKVKSSTTAQMIDACHIVPFSKSHDDSLTNGIALCPNLHRAFDRGLITISGNYKVSVSMELEDSGSNYSVKQFHGKKILLPENPKFYPSQENLEWHRKERYIL